MNTKAEASTAKVPLVVANDTIWVTQEVVPIESIRLNPENPRVRLLVERKFGKKKPTPTELLEVVKDQPSYDDLQRRIRKAGGIFEPVIVSHDGMVVEGNTRLTIFAVLHAGNDQDPRWKQIQITRLPQDVPRHVLEILMASVHVARKTVWRPYAQADSIYRLHKVHGRPVAEISEATGMAPREIDQYIEAYNYLVTEVLIHAEDGKEREVLEKKFHHALEFVKGKKLTELREKPEIRQKVAKAIAENKIKGLQIRQLHKVLNNPKASAALTNGGFDAANSVLRKSDPVSSSNLLKQMQKLTVHIRQMDQPEIDLFKTSKDARDVLVALDKTIHDAAEILCVTLRG
jgi:hypothetical protein